jgi:hypothetical protein
MDTHQTGGFDECRFDALLCEMALYERRGTKQQGLEVFSKSSFKSAGCVPGFQERVFTGNTASLTSRRESKVGERELKMERRC